jgi:hypothetical protein
LDINPDKVNHGKVISAPIHLPASGGSEGGRGREDGENLRRHESHYYWVLARMLTKPVYSLYVRGLEATLGRILAEVLSLYLSFTTIILITALIIAPPIHVISTMKRPDTKEV